MSPPHQSGPGPSNTLSTTATTLLTASKGSIFLETKHLLPKNSRWKRGRSYASPGLPSTSFQLQSCSGKKLSATHGTTIRSPLCSSRTSTSVAHTGQSRSRRPCLSSLHPPEQEHPQPPSSCRAEGGAGQDRTGSCTQGIAGAMLKRCPAVGLLGLSGI